MAGVVFPAGADGKRATTGPAKAIWARAFRGADADGAAAVLGERNWRAKYAAHLVPLTEKSARTPEVALEVARAGLEAVHDTFEFERDGETVKLAEAMKSSAASAQTGVVRSESADEPKDEEAFAVQAGPGKCVAGADLEALVADKVSAGEIEPDVLEALRGLNAHRAEWRKALKDTYFVILGATSELCPLEPLLAMGLNVVAIARPNAKRQAALIAKCRAAPKGASLTVPVLGESADASRLTDPDYLASVAGADVITHTPELKNWLCGLAPGKRLVLGSYIYLDGADHVRASVAMDAILAGVIEARPDTALMYLGTPAVVYPIPRAATEESVRRREKTPFWHKVASFALGPFEPNTTAPIALESVNPKAADTSKEMFLYNGISNIQGPNYMLAKTLQNWRAMLARETTGTRVSVNMTPMCTTHSVMHVKSVAHAVRGLQAFAPLVAYDPATARSLMALLMVYDMCSNDSPANPTVPLRNPLDIFATLGVHGGIWRCPYSQESLGKTAFLLGALHIA